MRADPTHDEGRPGERAALSVNNGDVTRIPPATLENPRAVAAGYAVLLVRRDERVTRQVYLSLHSATRALERARANGREARMVLVELVPVTSAPVVVVEGGAA